MTVNRWKSLAYATIVAACSVLGMDQPLVTVAAKAPAVPRLAVAAVNPPRVLDWVKPPVVSGADTPVPVPAEPSIADTAAGPAPVAAGENPPAPTTSHPAITAAKEPPAAARAVKPLVTPEAQPSAEADLSVVTAAKNPPAADDEKPVVPFDRRILAVHNRERQGLGLEPLNWNPALAQSAQRWAEHLAQTGRFEHAPENRSVPEGENLWAGTKGYYTPEAMVGAWIREKRFFRPGLFPDNSITGKVEDIGHYTQMVWRATREVGCAEAASANEDILVCRYAEAGNYRGEQPF
jgi:uncharacterized protein YkwD